MIHQWELTCPLDSKQHIKAAHCRKQHKLIAWQLFAILMSPTTAQLWKSVFWATTKMHESIKAIKDSLFIRGHTISKT